MDKQLLFLGAITLCILGCTIAGLSLGLLFSEVWVGVLMGVGVGLLVAAVLLLSKAKKT